MNCKPIANHIRSLLLKLLHCILNRQMPNSQTTNGSFMPPNGKPNGPGQ